MAGYHKVVQGDTVPKLAKQYGFADYQTIWDDANNADLKALRKNPNILFPGDSIFIPGRNPGDATRPADQKHRFTARTTDLKLRLTLEDQFEKPIAGAKCVLVLDSQTRNVTTDSEGRIEETVAPGVHAGILVVQDAQTPLQDLQIPIKVGHLDPVEEVPGQLARLNNLGYFAGDADKPDAAAFQSAVEEFQCDFGLKVDGVCGPMTQAKLKKVHGC